MSTLDIYRELRTQDLGARHALAVARDRDAETALDWNDDRATAVVDGFDIVARIVPDYDCDLSYLGAFTDTAGADTVPVPDDMRHAPAAFRVDYRHFDPTISASEHREALSRLGYARHTADCLARDYVRRDMRALLDTESYVVTVTASRAGVDLASSSVGGIDFLPSSTPAERERYLDEVADDLIAETIEEAQKSLSALCAA